MSGTVPGLSDIFSVVVLQVQEAFALEPKHVEREWMYPFHLRAELSLPVMRMPDLLLGKRGTVSR
jgi:hypothetical protein